MEPALTPLNGLIAQAGGSSISGIKIGYLTVFSPGRHALIDRFKLGFNQRKQLRLVNLSASRFEHPAGAEDATFKLDVLNRNLRLDAVSLGFREGVVL